MHYGDIEISFNERINSYVANKGKSTVFKSYVYPDTERDSSDFSNDLRHVSKCAVQFIDSLPGPTQTINQVVQEETVVIRIHFFGRRLRGADGTYQFIDLVKRSLIGFLPANGANRVIFKKFNFMTGEQNELTMYADFEYKVMNVQDFDDLYFDDPIGGNINSINS